MTKYTAYVGRALLVGALVLSLSVPFLGLPSVSFAQDDEPTTPVLITGSTFLEAYVSEIVSAYQSANEDVTEFSFQPGGNDGGFASLCDGSADVVMSTRDITDEEIVNCAEAGVEFVEVVIGAEALVLIPNQEITATTACVSADSLPGVLGSSVVEPLTWTAVSPLVEPAEVTLYGPAGDSLNALLANLLPDGQVNPNYEQFENAADVLPQLQDPTSNTLAFMSLADWNALEDAGDLVPFTASEDALSNCLEPTVDNVINGEYPLGRRFLLYVNAASLSKDGVSPLLDYALSESGAPMLASNSGFSAPSEDAVARGLANITNSNTGRTFTRANTPFDINTAAAGEVNVTTVARANIATSVVNSNFANSFPNVTVNVNPATEDEAWAAFCNGETDIIQVTSLRECDNGTTAHSISYGGDAAILLVGNDDLPACVSYEDINSLLANSTLDPNKGMMADDEAETEGDDGSDTPEQTDPAPQGPTDWSGLGVDLPLLILAPDGANVESDVIFSVTAPGQNYLPRNDAPTVQFDRTDTNLNPLDYRVAGLAQYEGGALTYMMWSDWQSVEDAPASVRALQVGSDCVAPTAETITDGSYPFSLNSYIVFSENALKNGVSASYAWYAYDSAALDQLAALNLAGFDRDALEAEQDARFDLFVELYAQGLAEAEAATEEDTTTDEDGADDATTDDTGAETDEATTDETTEEADDGDTSAVEETSGDEETTEEDGDTTPEATEVPTEDGAAE